MDTSFLATILEYIQTFVIIGGGLLCLWGLIALGTAIKDHNGPAIQQQIWAVVGARSSSPWASCGTRGYPSRSTPASG